MRTERGSPLASLEEAMAYLRTSRWSINRMRKSGELKRIKIRGRSFYLWSELRAIANPDIVKD